MNAIVRAVRTYLQVFIGLLIAGWADVAGIDSALTLGKSALLASIPAGLSLIQNLLEDSTAVEVRPELKG